MKTNLKKIASHMMIVLLILLIALGAFITDFGNLLVSCLHNYTNLEILYFAAAIMTRKFKLRGLLKKEKLYHNLYEFLKRLDEQYIKILVKITVKDSHSKLRIITLTQYVYIDFKNKDDIQSLLIFTINKFRKYMDHYHPISINGLFVDYLSLEYTEYLDNKISNPWNMKNVNLDTFTFPLTVDYEELANKIDTSNNLFTEYTECKGFKDSKIAKFRVSLTYESEKIKIFAVYFTLNKELFQFNDILDKESGILTRKFIDGSIMTNESFQIEKIK
jgi:hypothetical protein